VMIVDPKLHMHDDLSRPGIDALPPTSSLDGSSTVYKRERCIYDAVRFSGAGVSLSTSTPRTLIREPRVIRRKIKQRAVEEVVHLPADSAWSTVNI